MKQVKLFVSDDACFPVPDQYQGFEVKVSGDSEEMAIPPRMSFVIDLGFGVELPKDVRVDIVVDTSWAKRGLILTNNTYPTGQKQPISFVGHNVGKQILAFNHGETIGKLTFVRAAQVALVKSE